MSSSWPTTSLVVRPPAASNRVPLGVWSPHGLNASLNRHHVHADHGEPAGIGSFGRGVSPRPPIPCYDAAKDIVVPTPNVHFPRTPFAPALELGEQGAERQLLMFYAGWNYGERYASAMQHGRRHVQNTTAAHRCALPNAG